MGDTVVAEPFVSLRGPLGAVRMSTVVIFLGAGPGMGPGQAKIVLHRADNKASDITDVYIAKRERESLIEKEARVCLVYKALSCTWGGRDVHCIYVA